MPVNAGWQWKAGEYPHQTGCAICKSSPRAAFAERWYRLPRNPLECEIFRRKRHKRVPKQGKAIGVIDMHLSTTFVVLRKLQMYCVAAECLARLRSWPV